MKLLPKNEFDSLVFLHSKQIRLEERVGGVLRLSFGPQNVFLAEEAARDFLYELTAYFARKDLEEYTEAPADDASLQESLEALTTLSLLRRPST